MADNSSETSVERFNRVWYGEDIAFESEPSTCEDIEDIKDEEENTLGLPPMEDDD